MSLLHDGLNVTGHVGAPARAFKAERGKTLCY